MEDLEKGKPFRPFQQLLCILPKESCDLLPESFRGYLRDTTSPLRTPFDFYPDQFEDDLYGSTRSHEAVSLIPFLNQEIVILYFILDLRSLSISNKKSGLKRLTPKLIQKNPIIRIQPKSSLSASVTTPQLNQPIHMSHNNNINLITISMYMENKHLNNLSSQYNTSSNTPHEKTYIYSIINKACT